MNSDRSIKMLTDMARLIHENSVAKGWWEKENSDGQLIALMHSELSEALEACRTGNPTSMHIPIWTSLEEELADVIIRALGMGQARGLDVPGAILAKMEFNRTRPYRHGGKKF